jgi:protein-tyrosine kinase
VSMRTPEQIALLSDYDTQSAYSEAYYTLLANIRFNWQDAAQRQHTVLIARPAPTTNPATVAANIAIAAAQSGMATTLVDANLHMPGLEQRFGMQAHEGLSDLLTESAVTPERVESCLKQTFVPHLRLLGAGSVKDAGALLLSPKLEEVIRLIAQCTGTPDEVGMVFFQCAPVLSGPDAALLAALVDQTILIVNKGSTTRAQVRRAQEQLRQAHAHVTGFAMLQG